MWRSKGLKGLKSLKGLAGAKSSCIYISLMSINVGPFFHYFSEHHYVRVLALPSQRRCASLHGLQAGCLSRNLSRLPKRGFQVSVAAATTKATCVVHHSQEITSNRVMCMETVYTTTLPLSILSQQCLFPKVMMYLVRHVTTLRWAMVANSSTFITDSFYNGWNLRCLCKTRIRK